MALTFRSAFWDEHTFLEPSWHSLSSTEACRNSSELLLSMWTQNSNYKWKFLAQRKERKIHFVFKGKVATHSRTLAWKIPWTEEPGRPGRLQSMGLLRVGHDWATSLSLFTFMYWRRKWQPTPVFLPGESQGRGSLVGCHLWGCTESDTTEAT